MTVFVALAVTTQAAAPEPPAAATDLPRVPPKSPSDALSSFGLRPGLEIETAAAEPLVMDPIAMSFDEQGRLYVVEMRDYSERREERLGRIRLLEDLDADGKFDKSTVFAEGLPWPTAVICYGGGVFVGSTPDILFFRDSNGDGRAEERKLVFSGFGASVQRLNVQALVNSFNWGPDNRIHGASGGNGGIIRSPEHPDRAPVDLRNSDFSFDPKTLHFRLENGGGQYGMTFDAFGRKFICSNSAHIRQVMYERGWVLAGMRYALPAPALDIPVDGPAGPVFRTSPDEPWRVLRTKWRVAGLVPGPIEGGGRASGYFTSATGVMIYRGDAIPELYGDAIVADVGSNLVHRKKLRRDGVAFRAERAADEQNKEFLTSTDLWFRPVSFANGPDGALYIADMYREVVEHPWSIPESIKKHLDLNSGNDRGRIYRIVPEGFKQKALPNLGKLSNRELTALLDHRNAWHRDTAARLLFERGETNAVTGRILKQRGTADQKELALRVALEIRAKVPDIKILAKDRSAAVRYMAAWHLARQNGSERDALLEEMLRKTKDPWEIHAIKAALSVDTNAQSHAVAALQAEPALTRPASRQQVIEKYLPSLRMQGDPVKGRTIYQARCASCHRLFGEGIAVGPDLQSVRGAGKETTLSNIVDPNREVPLRYITYEIVTRGGDEYSGILSHESENGVTLLQANGMPQFIPRADVERFRATGLSLMPEALEEGLGQQDFADLLSYLASE